MDSEVVGSAEISALIVHSCSHAVAALPRWVFLGALSDLRDSTPTVLSITFINSLSFECTSPPGAESCCGRSTPLEKCGLRNSGRGVGMHRWRMTHAGWRQELHSCTVFVQEMDETGLAAQVPSCPDSGVIGRLSIHSSANCVTPRRMTDPRRGRMDAVK